VSWPLSIRASPKSFTSTTQIVEPAQPSADDTLLHSPRNASSSLSQSSHGTDQSLAPSQPRVVTQSTPTTTPPPSHPLWLSDSVRALLPHLAAQPGQYIRIHIHGFPYLVTAGDQVRLPFKMPGVVPGDVLRLNRASVLGSRDFTLQGGSGTGASAAAPQEKTAQQESAAAVAATEESEGVEAGSGSMETQEAEQESGNGAKMLTQPPYIDERLFECRATVLGTESEPMRTKLKKKRRNRKMKTVKSKHRYTILRISELKINQIEELEL
jgi:large subunit ribosomal protein L21